MQNYGRCSFVLDTLPQALYCGFYESRPVALGQKHQCRIQELAALTSRGQSLSGRNISAASRNWPPFGISCMIVCARDTISSGASVTRRQAFSNGSEFHCRSRKPEMRSLISGLDVYIGA